MNRFWSRASVDLLVSIIFMCFSGAGAASPAAELRLLMEEPTNAIVSGRQATLWIHVLNTSDSEQRWTFPSAIGCYLVVTSHTNEVSLELVESASPREVKLGPGQFERRNYRFAVPSSAQGRGLLERIGLNANRVVLDVVAAAAVADSPSGSKPAVEKFVKKAEPVRPGETFDPGRFFREHVSSYEPLYFIAGTESPNAKFQISFKYRLLNNDGPLAQSMPPLAGFHLAYSQTSLWDWNALSAPFFDSSYRPEILYLAENLTRAESNDWFRVDVQAGFQHESNGKDGTNSRSLNIAYLRPAFVFGKQDGLQLTLQPRVWTYIGDLSDNPDIANYRGYADLRAIVGWQRGPQLSATGRLGKDGNHESLQLDFTYPLMGFFPRSFSLYLHVQYFAGFGESLRRYNERDSALRAGFALTR